MVGGSKIGSLRVVRQFPDVVDQVCSEYRFSGGRQHNFYFCDQLVTYGIAQSNQ